MKKDKKNITLPSSYNQFKYDFNKPLDDYVLSESAKEYLKIEVNFVIEKILIDAKEIAKHNNDKILIRSYLKKASNKVFKKKKTRYLILSGVLGGIFISTTFAFVPQLIDNKMTNESMLYLLISTIFGSILLTYSIIKRNN